MQEIDLGQDDPAPKDPAGTDIELIKLKGDTSHGLSRVFGCKFRPLAVMKVTFSLLLLGITAFLWFQALSGPLSYFAFHLVFMSVGYLVLMFQAILLFSSGDSWPSNLGHNTKVQMHWLLQGLAVTCATLGFGAIYLGKIELKKDHFTTNHGNWGLATFIATHLVVSGGVLAKYSFQLRAYVKPVVVKLVHSLFGVVVYFMAIVTIVLALYSAWWDRSHSSTLRIIFLVILGTSTAFLVYQPLIACGKRFKTAFIKGTK